MDNALIVEDLSDLCADTWPQTSVEGNRRQSSFNVGLAPFPVHRGSGLGLLRASCAWDGPYGTPGQRIRRRTQSISVPATASRGDLTIRKEASNLTPYPRYRDRYSFCVSPKPARAREPLAQEHNHTATARMGCRVFCSLLPRLSLSLFPPLAFLPQHGLAGSMGRLVGRSCWEVGGKRASTLSDDDFQFGEVGTPSPFFIARSIPTAPCERSQCVQLRAYGNTKTSMHSRGGDGAAKFTT